MISLIFEKYLILSIKAAKDTCINNNWRPKKCNQLFKANDNTELADIQLYKYKTMMGLITENH